MTLQQLTYLVTVAECGNITEAAEKLFISQPSLSTAIHNLEKEMHVTAFTRSNKGVVSLLHNSSTMGKYISYACCLILLSSITALNISFPIPFDLQITDIISSIVIIIKAHSK